MLTVIASRASKHKVRDIISRDITARNAGKYLLPYIWMAVLLFVILPSTFFALARQTISMDFMEMEELRRCRKLPPTFRTKFYKNIIHVQPHLKSTSFSLDIWQPAYHSAIRTPL